MRILALGFRGFPNVQGGIEKHCEQLYPRLVNLGCEVIVFSRTSYTGKKEYTFKGVTVHPLWSLRYKSLETLIHTFIATLRAVRYRPDIIHYHAVGPGFFVPLARLLKMKVVATHHGFDYERTKWGRIGRAFLKMGERNMCSADRILAVSSHIQESLARRFNCRAAFIPNGVELPTILPEGNFCKKWGVTKGKYFLFTGRLVPEKCIHDIFNAFEQIETEWKLIIAGNADHRDAYSRKLKERAATMKNVVLTGGIYGDELSELYSNAGCFILPSSIEGLPIVLLEALSYGLPCIVSDIPPNRAISHPMIKYFPVHDIPALIQLLEETIHGSCYSDQNSARDYVSSYFNWDIIAQKTLHLFEELHNERT